MLTSRLWMGILIFIIIIGTASITTFTVQRSGCLNPIQKWLPSRYPYQPTGPNIDTTSPAQAITSTSIESSTRTSCPSELPPAGPTNRPPVDIFVMVLSGPPFPQRRDAIRQTWAQHLVKYNISTTPRDPNAMTFQYRFFMGRDRTYSANETCAEERKKYNDDIVVIPTLVDEYFTMTAKRQRAIAWIMKYYAPKYIIKIDDDTYLNVPLLMKKYRDDKWSTERFYMGYMFDSNMPVLRNIPGHRNAETDLDPALTKYPKFASGAGYVLSGDVGQYLATPPLRTRENSPNEDAILGLAFLYFDIEYRHENDIHAYPMKDGECRNPQQMLIQHYTPPKGMGEIHTCVEKNTEVCRRGW